MTLLCPRCRRSPCHCEDSAAARAAQLGLILIAVAALAVRLIAGLA